ncbi:MAG: hypothetical protein Q9187_002069 [Circinaria calcarea]
MTFPAKASQGRLEAGSSEAIPQHEKNGGVSTQPTLPDSGGDAGTETSKKSLSFWLSFAALNCTVFIVSLDSAALAIAVPRITQDLQGTTLEAFWANISFILAIVITQPIYSTISDVLGRKIPLYAAFLLFFIGSIVFGVAKSMPVLIVGRILQGLGGGGLDVLSEIILADITTLKERPLFLGLYALPMAGGGVCGPIIGAAFSEFVHWRWIGWINLPIIAVGVVLAFFFLHLRPIDSSLRSKLRRLDWIGMLLFTVGTTTFALPLSWAGALYPWSSWRTILPLIIGVVILVVFGVYESKPAEPIFPYRMFGNRTAVASLIGAAVHGAVLYCLVLYLPLFFQAVVLETPFRSAVSVLPASACIIGFSILGVIIVEIVRRYRWGVIAAALLMTLGVGLWSLWRTSSSRALLYGLQIIPSIGVGTLFTILTIPMTASVKHVDDMGIAAGMIVSFRLFGALVGLATCSTVFNNIFEQQIASMETLPPSVEILKDVREAISFIPSLSLVDLQPKILEQVIEAYRVSITTVFLTLTGIGAVGFIASLFTRELTLEKENLGRQQFENSS